MVKGIICFEAGEFEKYNTKNQFYALPLLEFMKHAMGIDFIYRQIVTKVELEYYLKKIGEKHFKNNFDVVYFSFHGESLILSLTRDGKNNLTIEELSNLGEKYKSFEERHIHFATCETFNSDEYVLKRFKKKVKAKTISGYTECVDATEAFINELAYFHQLMKYSTAKTIKEHMFDYQNQLNKLGFSIF